MSLSFSTNVYEKNLNKDYVFTNNTNIKKKSIDEFCNTNNDCESSFCKAMEECSVIVTDKKLCDTIKTCQTSNKLSNNSNFLKK